MRELTRLGDDECWIEARPSPVAELSVRFRIDYGNSGIGRQTVQLPICPNTFRRDFASARTFMLKEEAEWLLAQGLGKRATLADLLVFDADGPIENELRYRDECVRATRFWTWWAIWRWRAATLSVALPRTVAVID